MRTIRDIWLSMKSVLRSARQRINDQLERLDISKATISRTIDSLAKKGYVKRGRQPDDKRAYCVKLTERAINKSTKIESAYNDFYEIIKQRIEEPEFQHLAMLLEKVAENLHCRRVED